MEDKTPIHCWYSQFNVSIDTRGYVTPCCAYRVDDLPYVERHTAIDLYNLPKIKSIRQNLKNGIRDSGCNECWNDEDNGITSMRQKKNAAETKYVKTMTEHGSRLTSLEIAFSNICNMTCRHCSTQSSSRWKKDDQLLGRWMPPKILNEASIDSLDIFSARDIEYMKFWGGEPFLAKSHSRLLKLLDENNMLEQLNVEYITNGSIFPSSEILTSWSKLKHLRIFLSIEDYGDKFDYFRTGASFQEFKENSKKYFELQSENVEIAFHLTLNAMNAYRIDEILKYYLEHFPECKFIRVDRVRNPEFLKAEQWDENTLLSAASRIRTHVVPLAKSMKVLYSLSAVIDVLRASAINKDADFSELFRVNNILDKSRNTSLDAVHPIFSKYRNNK